MVIDSLVILTVFWYTPETLIFIYSTYLSVDQKITILIARSNLIRLIYD